MSYTALLTLSALRDDFAALDRPALGALLRACQQPDGGYLSLLPLYEN
jgi:geranylgeranyl transferase type-1 subunit beta